ncbi:MAG: hypothetical protein NVSMB63_03520 [Sediminibacterium sp.]
MTHFWIAVMSLSIAPGALIGFGRLSVIHRTYRPFVYFLAASLLYETISVVAEADHHSNALNNNLFILVEWVLLAWLMGNWFVNKQRRRIYAATGVFISLLWFFDMLVWNDIDKFNSLFRICSSFAIVFMAIDHLNALIVLERNNLLKNARFLISCGLIIYFSYKTILEVLYLLHLNTPLSFNRAAFSVLTYINVCCNIIYTIASICLPVKHRFIFPYL